MTAPATSNSSPTPRVLTVLNDPARAAMYEYLAGLAGFEVVQAEGGLHALTQLERTKVNAIICDAMMPDMTGAEFCSVVDGDTQTKNLPVYLIPNQLERQEGLEVPLGSVAAGPEVLSRAFRHLGVDSTRLPAPLNSLKPAQLDGELKPFQLADFLNWVAELGFSGHWIITVKPRSGGRHTGHLAMNQGKVVYAEFGGRSGKPAILTLLRSIDQHPQAEFKFYQSGRLDLSGGSEFTQSTARLLIELAVDLDESHATHHSPATHH